MVFHLGAESFVQYRHQAVHQPCLGCKHDSAVQCAWQDASIQIVKDESLGSKQGK
jgi:hypothetical protein